MAILPDFMIRALRVYPTDPPEARRVLEPWSERATAHGMSYGLSCAGYDVRLREAVHLRPGDFRLASTLEHFWMPDNILARVADKSTLARMGLAVQNTVIEPGWRGYLTLELTNHGDRTLLLESGTPIAQIIFEELYATPERPYSGKYNDQPPEPVPAKFDPD